MESSVWQDFKSGFQYMRSWPGLIIIGLMMIGINFTLIPAFSLMPLMVKEYFGGSAIQLGWVESSMGIGMIIGGALLGVWGGFKNKILTSMIGLFGVGIGTLILAFAPSSMIILAVVGAAIVGLMLPITNGPLFAVVQSVVEPDMQARVFSMISSFGGAMVPIGLMFAGPVADRFGIQSWFFLAGGVCILMAVAGLMIPAVMGIEKNGRIQADKKRDLISASVLGE